MNRGAPDQEEGKKNEKDGERSIQRPDKCFVDTEVHCLLEVFISAFDHIFPDPVEDNDGVMHTIAGDS